MAAVQQMPSVPTGVPRQAAAASDVLDIREAEGASSGSDTADTALDTPVGMSGLAIGSKFGSGPQRGDTRIVVIVYGRDQEEIISVFAEVLGKPYCKRPNFDAISIADKERVIGIYADNAKADIGSRNTDLVVAINAHCVSLGMPPDSALSEQCDYEFLYTNTPFFRRDLSRFISFTLGQINHHQTLMDKPRTYFISTTFPDVRVALPNIDILTVGSDAVEIRVDLLKEPLADGAFAAVPSLSYVGEQVMTLRQRTELPIIFTTRCQRENGRFPMDNPDLYYQYLYRAIQWGVEYIDVELWLPETIRKRLYERRGNSRIMSAYHDFSSTLKWPTPEAQAIYAESCKYADIVKMITYINDRNENFELEYFRSKIRAEYPNGPPLSAVNMGEMGQFSRTQNHVFSPITHPLLPVIAAPGQMSAAETNAALSMLGQLPKKIIYGITSPSSRSGTPQAPFYVKCFNELGLPHQFAVVEQQPKGPNRVETWCNQKNFGGAYLHPPLSYASLISKSAFFSSLGDGAGPILTDAARVIGNFDTIIVRSLSSPPQSTEVSEPSSPYHHQNDNGNGSSHSVVGGSGTLPPNTQLVFDNASWRGILSTLTRDLAPSAYFGRTAVVLASSSDDAASAVFALGALRISKVYTVGFKTPSALAGDMIIEPFNSLESLQKARTVGAHDDFASPFVIISALAPEKGNLVGLLLRVFGSSKSPPPDTTETTINASSTRKVFLDLAADSGSGSFASRKADPGIVAEQSGFAVYGSSDVNAFTTVETLRLLVGQNVPYSFVRLAGGRSPF
ncbi:3-dehydroquinate dehydratase I [Sporothrix schenckii 1099-18]|uniref:3-dehydroquinate dehydratase I n=1 Tax=Sporothrix schenckii 1099-18 TaxID=1397361 RepID=A0A0F2LV52_SPOSC|nr:3-dehydroquinate dehydratase I [Sporothrix schenckii 1099-18]KJR81342.1 3-dehydroquinate dehydratase I [Sporothrix schenckii 1099-18]